MSSYKAGNVFVKVGKFYLFEASKICNTWLKVFSLEITWIEILTIDI